MKITEVKTAFKIMDVDYNKNQNESKLIFNYLNDLRDEKNNKLPKNILTTNVSRVYMIIVNKEIKKIGSSSDKGGMKGTLAIYKDGGIKGRPSVRSYGIFHLLMEEVKKGSKIEFYMIFQNEIKGTIKGLLKEYEEQNIHISPKLIEERCIIDYRNIENGNYPEWNFQEQGKDWPDIIKKIHSDIYNESLQRPKRKSTNKIKK